VTQTVHYDDRTIATVARVAKIATLAGIASVALALADIADFSVPLSLILTAFCAVAAVAYHRGTGVRLEIGPEGMTKHQALGMGWNIAWSDVDRLVHVPVKHPVLAVVSPALPTRTGPTEWPIRNAGLPANTHGVPATPEIVDAVRQLSGRKVE
jgi:hypothetical protein